MYTITRQEAADVLNMSTRSIDRYIRAWKLRFKKDGKIIFINNQDIENIRGGVTKHEVIYTEKVESQKHSTSSHDSQATRSSENTTKLQNMVQEKNSSLHAIYEDLRNEINKKDDVIQHLAIKLGQAEEIAKNSISLIEFKKSQFLLEESKWYLSQEVDTLRGENNKLSKDLKYEKSTNTIMVFFLIALLALTAVIWFVKI